MTARQEILNQIKTLLAKEKKSKSDLRSVRGNLERLIAAPRIKDLSLEELSICQQASRFLKE